jgi:hypothetical protein
LNRAARSGNNTVNTTLSIDELKGMVGNFRDTQNRPTILDPRLVQANGTGNPQFFTNPLPGTVGILALTPFSGPGFFNFDGNILKSFRIMEGKTLTFRAEAFNMFNTVNFSVGEAHSINSTSFGRITQTFAPRILQMSLKFSF